MKNFLLYSTILMVAPFTQAKETQQSKTIQQFMQSTPPQAKHFNCSYQQRNAPKKCLVSLHLTKLKSSLTQAQFDTQSSPILKIQWPDGEVNHYALINHYKLLNIHNEQYYEFKTISNSTKEIDFSDGLIILDKKNEHIRLWDDCKIDCSESSIF